MPRLHSFTMACTLTLLFGLSFTAKASCDQTPCCDGPMGGVSYCDASAGRYVCRSGEYSACYCTRHAVMDLQRLAGCCLWHGGVMATDIGIVTCNDGSLSEECGLQNPAHTLMW